MSLPDAAPALQAVAWPDDAVEVGRILGAWGIKGGIKVAPFADDPQALLSTSCWFLKPAEVSLGKPAATSKPGGRPVPAILQVRGVREQADAVVAQSDAIADRDAAEALKGARVFVSRATFPSPEPDEFYWVDLIGASVTNREGVLLGEVVGLIDTGVHSVLRVRAPASGVAALQAGADTKVDPKTDPKADPKTESAPERLIPFVEAYVDSVDVPGRAIVVDWGLDY